MIASCIWEIGIDIYSFEHCAKERSESSRQKNGEGRGLVAKKHGLSILNLQETVELTRTNCLHSCAKMIG